MALNASERAILRAQRKEWHDVIFRITAISFVILLLFWQFFWKQYRISKDAEGAPKQRGTAEITQIMYGQVTSDAQNPPATIVLKLSDGKIAQMQSYAPLFVGQRVSIEYQMGKSGRVYVDQMDAVNPSASSKP